MEVKKVEMKIEIEVDDHGAWIGSKNFSFLVNGNGSVELSMWDVFQDWLMKFDHTNIELKGIKALSVNMRGDQVFFAYIKVISEIRATGYRMENLIFMRADSVAILIMVKCPDNGETYALLTEQKRLPAGTLSMLEISAGSLDKKDGLRGRTIAEIEEETGIRVSEEDLIYLGICYPSPGACCERITTFLVKKELSLAKIKEVEKMAHGVEEEGEQIRVKFIPLPEFLKMLGDGTIQDGKALAALSLLLLKELKGDLGVIDTVRPQIETLASFVASMLTNVNN